MITDPLKATNILFNDQKDELHKPPRMYAWRRLFARSFDVGLISWALTLMIAISCALNDIFLKDKVFFYMRLITWLHFLAVFISLFYNAGLVSLFGATPGKKIFGIEILNADNSKLSFYKALEREWLVVVNGLMLYIPILAWVGMWLAYSKLIDTGKTSWDRTLNVKVNYLTRSWIHTTLILTPALISIILMKLFGVRI